MKITIYGTGYQGLVTGVGLAEHGHQVTCIDKKSSRVEMLRRGELPFHEPGLEELLNRNLEEERLLFSTGLEAAVADCLLVFLCVPVPATDEGHPDLTEIKDAVRRVAEVMDGYRILVNKSTCPPGTADALGAIMRGATDHAFDIVVNPDFMKEGAAIDDFLRPDRVVVGCDDVRVREILKELYAPFVRTGKPVLCMTPRSAEMTKYATNVMLAARISLMNQLADLCEACGADVSEVREGVGMDDRIGPKFLFPGIGFGGSGLPKDLSAMLALSRDLGRDADLIEAIHNVNERQFEKFAARILGFYGDAIAEKTIAVWGVSFKPRTNDCRGAPAMRLIERLLDAGAQVTVYDPVAGANVRKRLGDRVNIARKYYDALEGAHGLAITTEWNEFRRPDYARMAGLMTERVIFDGRNLYTPSVIAGHGFRYFSIGRPAV